MKVRPDRFYNRHCLRRVALRAVSTPSPIVSLRSRSFISITTFDYRNASQKSQYQLLQRRFASEEAQSRSEPEVDVAAEAQHEDNSISKSAATEQSAPKDETIAALGDAASSATETVKQTASNAFAASTGAAQQLQQTLSNPPPPDSRIEVPEPNTIYVGNLFFDVRENDLRTEFEQIGQVQNVKVIFDNRGLSKG